MNKIREKFEICRSSPSPSASNSTICLLHRAPWRVNIDSTVHSVFECSKLWYWRNRFAICALCKHHSTLPVTWKSYTDSNTIASRWATPKVFRVRFLHLLFAPFVKKEEETKKANSLACGWTVCDAKNKKNYLPTSDISSSFLSKDLRKMGWKERKTKEDGEASDKDETRTGDFT